MKAELIAQGEMLTMKVSHADRRAPTGGGRRGKITTFSPASRRRMMHFMARIQSHKFSAKFITLTFNGDPTNDEAKKAFRRFAERLKRFDRAASAVWRMEYQPKRGAIHFHLMAFRLKYWSQRLLQRAWEGCTGESRSIVHIKEITSHRMMRNYIAKYIAKVDRAENASLEEVTYSHAPRDDIAGRFWGYIKRAALPLGEEVGGVLIELSTIKALSDMAWQVIGDGFRYGSLSFSLMTPFAYELCDSALARGGLSYDEYRDGAIDSTVFYKVRNGTVTRF